MTDLQTFTASILARKEEELLLLWEKAEASEQARREAGLAAILEKEEAEKAKLDKQFALGLATASQAIDNKTRNSILAHRQEQLHSLFDKAYEQMAAWDRESFAQFFNRVIGQLDPGKSYSLQLGQKTQHALDLPENITLLSEPIADEAGFVLEADGIRYNYLFRALLNDVVPDVIGRLSKQLDS